MDSDEQNERYKKLFASMQSISKNHPLNISWDNVLEYYKAYRNNYPTYTGMDYGTSTIVPFEQDQNGTLYGYKILLKVDYMPWLCSPARTSAIWHYNKLTAHKEPDGNDLRYGIHGTKDILSLEQWARYYARWHSTFELKVVHLAVYGTVIETEFGFRAQHAEIVRMIGNCEEVFIHGYR